MLVDLLEIRTQLHNYIRVDFCLRIIFSTFFQVPVGTLLGATFQPFFLQLIDNDPDLKNARVTLPFNIRASNGRIHSISRVLIPIDLP